MQQHSLAGVVTPLLTPFDSAGRLVRSLYADHAARCLADGSHFLSPFGTTGEATSVAMSERMALLEWLVAKGGIAADRL
ncbi:MAG: dihydrodipicolinate synthase family protein, partial [Pseudomonadota bacterium]